MTGIEKIIEKIENDCKASCDEILSNARAQEKSILENAAAAGEKDKETALQTASDLCSTELVLAKSRLENESKQATLAAKLDIMNQLIADAMQKLKYLPDDEYFGVLEKLILQNAQQGKGVLRLSEKDLNRLPKDFSAVINSKLESGKTVSVNLEPAAIDGGFIILYNDIEQNCSFDALLYESMEKIKDELYQFLFMRNSI